MKLSIITINFNNLDGLQKTIDSVLCQTWKEFEWIFIDGGSTDGSKELIKKTAAECSNVSYWCSEPDKGVYNAQNKGITHANGEYMNFMNSGDIFYDKNVLLNIFNVKQSADVIYGDWYWCDKNNSWIDLYPKKVSIASLYCDNICHQAMFIKGEILKEKGYDESYTIVADWARWMELACKGNTFQYIPVVVCKYQLGGFSSANEELAQQEIDRVRQIPPSSFCESLQLCRTYKEKLDRYERLTNLVKVVELIEERQLYRRLFRISVGGIEFIKSIIDPFLKLLPLK